MPHMYSAGGHKIALALSADDIGVRFDNAEIAATAVRAARGAAGPLQETSPRAYGRVVLLHETGSARTAFSTVQDAMPRRVAANVQRTLPVYIEQASGLRLITTREISVRFKPAADANQIDRLLTSMNLAIRQPNEFTPTQYIVAPTNAVDESATLDLANSLRAAESLVEYAAPNFIAEHRKQSVTDPLFRLQWHLHNTGYNGAVTGEDVNALKAWTITNGGSPKIVIAIVDDGVDIEHPDLRDNIWENPDTNALDRHGRNFYDRSFDPRPAYFRRPFDQMEGNDIHGTPCAGVAAASRNRRGVVGIAYRCQILPVKIFGADSLASNSQVADAIRYAGKHAQIISCSWVGPQNADLESAVEDVTRHGRGGKGCLLFCATGNDGQPNIGYPARYRAAFAVGAVNDQGKRSSYSNYGNGIQFVAPSDDEPVHGRQAITTTDIARRNRGFNLGRAYTTDFGGTSSATPLAAGVAALVLSVNPDLTRLQVRNILRASAVKVNDTQGEYQTGYSRNYGYGRLDAYEAVKRAQQNRSTRRQRHLVQNPIAQSQGVLSQGVPE